MTGHHTRFDLPKPARLADSALSPEAQTALLDLEEAFFHWHRQMLKGELTGRLLAESDLDLEPALFQGMTAIVRIKKGVGRGGPAAPTVGLVAEEMSVDPSRASRITSELIRRGYVAREAAQEDGRKSVLRLTPRAEAAFKELRDAKWRHFLRVFSAWPEEDILAFARLFERYSGEIMAEGQAAEQ